MSDISYYSLVKITKFKGPTKDNLVSIVFDALKKLYPTANTLAYSYIEEGEEQQRLVKGEIDFEKNLFNTLFIEYQKHQEFCREQNREIEQEKGKKIKSWVPSDLAVYLYGDEKPSQFHTLSYISEYNPSLLRYINSLSRFNKRIKFVVDNPYKLIMYTYSIGESFSFKQIIHPFRGKLISIKGQIKK